MYAELSPNFATYQSTIAVPKQITNINSIQIAQHAANLKTEQFSINSTLLRAIIAAINVSVRCSYEKSYINSIATTQLNAIRSAIE